MESTRLMKKIGRYQITRELGRGAMGVVYHAIDPTIGRAVAIKTLRLREVDDGEQRLRLRERLFREARSAGALSHPGIVTIYDMDEVDGLAYIAMEFVDGQTLEEILSRPEAIGADRLKEVLRQAAAALDYAHRKGIIHRDIKPANIMIDQSGAVKITDFGIAKIAQVEGQTLTGVLVGTPNYMSPEQVQGQEVDGRSDQFSLAVIAYEMLCGERPFFGEQISTVVYKIVAEQPTPIPNLNTTLNENVDKAVRRALAKKPERRFATCTAFVTGLESGLAATKAWKAIPRKAQHSMPTASTGLVTPAFQPVPKMEPALKNETERKRGVAAAAAAKERDEGGGWFLPFFGAFVVLAIILALVAWQTGMLDLPWLNTLTGHDATPADSSSAPPAADRSASDRPSPMPAPPSDAEVPLPKPAPPVTATEAPQPVSHPPAEPSAGPVTNQKVQVMTDPAGATAMLDSNPDLSCITPCSLNARTGVHDVTVRLEGYQPERREVHITDQDVEVPLVSLRSANGVLMLTSDPSGAEVFLDGKDTGYQTPARISLTAGRHLVAIQNRGMRASDVVDIANGDFRSLKLIAQR
jgi:tRNA A-37 threonylcarbamoyl transferase component Bud32